MDIDKNVIAFLLKEIEKKDQIINNMNKRREDFCKEYTKRREESIKRREDYVENISKRHKAFHEEYDIIKKT